MQTFLFPGIPTFYLIGKDGKIICSFSGLTDDAVNQIIRTLD